jgi:hypothetical protein
MSIINMKQKEFHDQKFYDKNGLLIKVGDRISTNIDEQFRDNIIYELDGKLGLYFKYGDYFITLESMLDPFFNTLEIIND